MEEEAMRGTNVISLEEIRETKRQAQLRQRLQQRFEQWFEKVEAEVNGSTATLAQLTGVVFNLRQELASAVVEGLIEQQDQAEFVRQESVCPECAQRLRSRRNVERTVETMVGTVTVSRPYFYCVRCQHGFYPLDQVLGLTKERKQGDVQHAVVQLTKEVPYETACEVFTELTGLSVSTHLAHDVTNTVAEGLTVLDVSPTREEVEEKLTAVAEGKKRRPILVCAIDGAAVPTRPEGARRKRRGRKRVRAKRACWQGEWREAKGFRLYLVDEERIVHLISWHQIQDEDGLFAALKQVKEAGLLPEDRVRLCVLADGARWIWNRIHGVFPTAQEILDYYHCSQYIHRVAQAQYPDQPHKALEWVEATMARLFCNEVQSVIWGLQRMKPRNEEADAEIKTTLGYLEHHKNRVTYGALRKGGYPLGSGGIESANKFICHVRLKRSGSWWYVANGNHMLALRCAKYNGTFDRIFERYHLKNTP